MKKNLLLIFGLLGLVSLMAESGPKRNNVLSMLGLDNDAACCDLSKCCVGSDASCCDISACCTTSNSCCAPATSCCTSDGTERSSTMDSENQVSQCAVSCK